MSSTGILLTGFGGPTAIQDVGPFMCNLMGREPSQELVDRVCMRYLAIGGGSPLPEIAQAIADKLASELGALGASAPIRVGMRYWHPYIEEAMADLKGLGCDRVVTVSLSPFESKVASDAYREAVKATAEEIGMEVVEAPLLSRLPEYVEFFAGATAGTLTDMEPNEGAIVVFTAHSLPEADLVANDPYVSGLSSIAQAVAERLGMALGGDDAGASMFDGFRAFGSTEYPRAWFLAYQSKGNKPGAWLGPELEDLIDAAAINPNVSAVVVAPIGFMTDHMETLYDLDIVAADRALKADLEFARVPVPNDHDTVIAALAKAVAPLI